MENDKKDLNPSGEGQGDGGNGDGGQGNDGGTQGQGQGKGEPQKRTLTPEQRHGMLRRQLTNLEKDHPELAQTRQERAEPQQQQNDQQTGLGYGEKAYLVAKGIPEEDFDY